MHFTTIVCINQYVDLIENLWKKKICNHFAFANFILLPVYRLTAANGELTITKTHGPTPSYSSTSSSSNHLANQHSSSMKMSPSSMHLSPTETDNSNADMLSDSPGKHF